MEDVLKRVENELEPMRESAQVEVHEQSRRMSARHVVLIAAIVAATFAVMAMSVGAALLSRRLGQQLASPSGCPEPAASEATPASALGARERRGPIEH